MNFLFIGVIHGLNLIGDGLVVKDKFKLFDRICVIGDVIGDIL